MATSSSNWSFDAGNALGGIAGVIGGIYAADVNSDDMQWAAKYNHAADLENMQISQGFNSAEAAKAYQRQVALYEQQFNDALATDNNKYQRTVRDLRLANLNPILAVQGMSATGVQSGTPVSPMASAAATGGHPANAMDRSGSITSAFKGAADVAKAITGLDLEKKLAETQSAKAGADLVKSQIANTDADTDLKNNKSLEALSNVDKNKHGQIGQIYNFGSKLGNDIIDHTIDRWHNWKAFLQDRYNDLFNSHSAKTSKDVTERANKAIDGMIHASYPKVNMTGYDESYKGKVAPKPSIHDNRPKGLR